MKGERDTMLTHGLAAFSALPDYMHRAVRQYVVERRAPGHFLTALISNNLSETIARADDHNIKALRDWVRLFYNYTPTICWGSQAKFEAWINPTYWETSDD